MTSTHARRDTTSASAEPAAAASLAERFEQVRRTTHRLQAPLSPEDCTTQSMPDASPAKWHLGHTTWFFERLVISEAVDGYTPHHQDFWVLFNSYYHSLGQRHPRPRRGLLSRPSLDDVLAYRVHVDDLMLRLLRSDALSGELAAIVEVGLNHEQQHQELLVTDVKHLLSCNPLQPAYHERPTSPAMAFVPLRWYGHDEGIYWIGHEGETFAYDNEQPRHRRFVEAFELANRPATCGEYMEFMRDGGYREPLLWLSNGWATVESERWQAPGYWEERDGEWHAFTLAGTQPVDPAEPVAHLSYFEADAFARWAGARLPSEHEWEIAAAGAAACRNMLESRRLHPAPVSADEDGYLQQIGDVWEWTKSGYDPYPGYAPPPGALGEYNSKFMCSQLVLRGGSCATPETHIRATYRNFFPPEARWQFSGLRLARDV